VEELFESAQKTEGGLLSMLGSLNGVAGLFKSAGSAALAAATGFDTAAGRFRNAQGQFQTASSAASGVFQGAMNKTAGGAKSVGPAITALGGVIKTLATADLPSASQGMQMFGAMLGGAVTGAASKASAALAALGPEGKAAGVAIEALAAAFAATIGTMTTVMGLAIELSQKADLMKSRFAALAGGAAGGAAVQASIAKLSATMPFATSQINEWAQSLLTAGLQGQELEGALRAVASAQALMGDSGAAAAQQMLSRLAMGGAASEKLMKDIQEGGRRSAVALLQMGLNMRDVAAAAGMSEHQFKTAHLSAQQMQKAIEAALAKKGAGPLEELGLTLPAILQKAREGFLSLFNGAGPAVKLFMQAVKSLFGEFNKGSPAIKGLKPIVTDVLTTLFGWATKAVNAIHAVVTGLMNAGKSGGLLSGAIAVLKAGWGALIAIWNVTTTVLAPIIGFIKAIFSNAMVLSGLKTVFSVIAGVIVGVVVAIATFLAVTAAIAGVVAGAIGALVGLASAAIDVAGDFVSGLVQGILNGGGAVAAAVSNLANSALGAFKGVLGIASPSKVMLEHGEENIAGAAATGIDKGSGKVKASARRMGDAAVPDGGARGPGPGGKGAGIYVDLRGSTFNGTDEGLIRRVMTKVWEELSGEAGAQPEGATA